VYQAIRIFKKDARYLWREICLFLTLAALFGWRDYFWAEGLLPVTAAYIIARLVHAEPLPGNTQFWVTRPYEWKSLLSAKLLFILMFLNVPILLARIHILADSGYPLSSEMRPLLWSQVLMIMGFCLPVAALATLTADTVPFFFATLILLVIGFVIQSRAIPFARSVVSEQGVIPWPEGVEWVRASFFLGVMIVTSIYLLRLQYKTRRTAVSRVIAVGFLVGGIFGYLTISPSLAMELHTRLSHPPPFVSQIRIDVEAKPRKFALPRRDLVQVSIPLNVLGLPPDVEARADALHLTIEGTGGRKWDTFTIPSSNAAVSRHSFDSNIFVQQSFFATEGQSPVKLSGSLYMTAFSGARSTPVTLTHSPLNVGDGLQCYVNDITSQLHCRSAFRWPDLLVYAKVRNDKESLWPMISYSPFPAGIELNYAEEHQAGGPPPHAPQATIIVMEPLSHFRTDFVIGKFNMLDFAR
jgi:hypothetical protein